MPFNGSGGFDPLPPPTFPAVDGTTILSDQLNLNLNDMFLGFANCVTRDGQSPATANLPMGGFKHTGAAAASAAGQYLVFGQTSTMGTIVAAAGAVATPSYTFAGDLNNGWWSPAADTQAWSLFGQERMRLNSVGLGVRGEAQVAPLEVGTGTTANDEIARFFGEGVQSRGLVLSSFQVSGTNGVGFNFNAPGAAGVAGTLSFSTNNVERVRIDSAGDVGIGTVTPLSTLDVGGTISSNAGNAAAPAWRFRGELNTGVFSPALGMLGVSCSGNEVARFRSTPGFSVGTTLTGATLMVDRLNGGSSSPGLTSGTVAAFLGNSAASSTAYITLISGNAGIAGINFGDTDADSRGWVRYANSTDALQFASNGAERWRITSIGTLEPAATSTYSVGSATNEVAQFFGRTFVRDSAGPLTISSINATGSLVFQTGGVLDRFVITSDGRIYGTALHNNAGSVTGTTNQYIASGNTALSYTNVANVAAFVASATQWIRTGNVVTVSGKVNVDPTAGGTSTQFRASLPIPSDLSASQQCSGIVVFQDSSGAKNPGTIQGDATNNEALFTFTPTGAAAGDAYFTFTYLIQ